MNVNSHKFLGGLLKVITEEMLSQEESNSDGCDCSSSTTWTHPLWNGKLTTYLDTIPKCCEEDKTAKALKIVKILIERDIVKVDSANEFIDLVVEIAKEI